MKADLSQVYSELDLPPECTLEEFRRAYLRRIAQLHPDRTGSAPATPEAQEDLQRLVSTYTEVTSFHRRYGRMPGAAPRGASAKARSPNAPLATGTGSPPRASSADHADSRGAPPEQPSKVTVRLVVIIVAMALLLAVWDLSQIH